MLLHFKRPQFCLLQRCNYFYIIAFIYFFSQIVCWNNLPLFITKLFCPFFRYRLSFWWMNTILFTNVTEVSLFFFWMFGIWFESHKCMRAFNNNMYYNYCIRTTIFGFFMYFIGQMHKRERKCTFPHNASIIFGLQININIYVTCVFLFDFRSYQLLTVQV